MNDDESELYRADEISFIAEGRPSPFRIPADDVDDPDDLTEAYFDGYPQLVDDTPSELDDNGQTVDGPRDIGVPDDEATLDDGTEISRDVTVEVGDGAELSVNVYRPDTDEPVPALLGWGMWGKDAQEAVFWMRDDPQEYQQTPFWDGSLEAGDTPRLTANGYAHVVPDPRGIGDSGGGPVANLLDLHDADDVSAVIEWIADQPWCDGSVGMIGPSSYAFSQAVVGQDAPDALDAMFPIAFWYLGENTFTGMRDTSLYNIFHGGHMYDSTHPLSLEDYTEPLTMQSSDDEEFDALLDEALNDPDVKYNSKYFTAFQYPMKDPMAFDLFVSEWFHPHEPPGDLSDIEESTYIGAVLPGGAHHRIYWEAFEAWEKVSTPEDERKLIVLPPGEFARPWVDYHDELLRWNDNQLRDADNGIDDEPAVKTYVIGLDKWTFEHDWPPERVEWEDRYLQPDGQLGEESPDGGTESWQQPIPLEDPDVRCLTFAEDIEEPLELVGPIEVHLEAAIDDEDTNWIVDLVDVSPDGDRQLVSQGWLRASYRGTDDERSLPGWPVHTTEKQPLEPGEPHEYEIAMAPTAAVVDEGHTLELVLRNQDDMSSQLADRGVYFLPLMRDVEHTVHLDGNSFVRLPVTGRGDDVREKLDNAEQFE